VDVDRPDAAPLLEAPESLDDPFLFGACRLRGERPDEQLDARPLGEFVGSHAGAHPVCGVGPARERVARIVEREACKANNPVPGVLLGYSPGRPG
jgi:hypothetical protein